MNPNQFEQKRLTAELRNATEAQFANTPKAETLPRTTVELQHELQVHQVELEMQNEELRRTQVALEESRDCYVDLYDFAPVGYLTLSQEGLIDAINLTGAALLGVERNKLLHRRFSQFVSSEGRDQWYQLFLYTLNHGEKHSCELALKRGDGTNFHARLDCLYVVSGASVAVRIALTDISDRKQVEEQLRQLNATLEQRVREETARNMAQEHLLIQQSRLAAMGEMISNIAHQWRQPLNTLGLVVQNVEADFQDNILSKEALGDYVATAMHSIQHMSSTIDDFRNFFKPSKEQQRFLVCDAVTDALKLVGQSFIYNNIEITLDMGSDACAVIGYPNEFAQVLVNILTNAKDAIVSKKNAGKIHIALKNEGDAITIVIRNNGGNIPETTLGKVFDPYFTTKESGTGIGLYMSKIIMDNMGGDIVIRNAGEGAEVMLHIPLKSDGGS